MSKINDAIAACITRLNADATMNTLGWSDGNIYWYHPPEAAPMPSIVLQKQTDAKTHRMGGIAYKRHWITFKVVDGGSLNDGLDGGKRARDIAERVEILLNNFRPVLPGGGYTMQICADTGFEYSEAEAGNKIWYHVGSTFTFWIGE
jgi:hypothetical protein